jgi:hypothetical protein
MPIQGIRYSYSDGGSVDIKYPRQKFEQGGQATFQDVNQTSPYSNSQAMLSVKPITITMADGSTQTFNSSGSGAAASSGELITSTPDNSDFVKDPPTNTSGGGGGSSGGDGNAATGVFGEVAAVYNDLRQNTSENQSVANSIFNRNVARKNLAMSEATTASNLRGAGQSQEQSSIQFGENQSDRAGQLKTAAAWAGGVAKGLTQAKT